MKRIMTIMAMLSFVIGSFAATKTKTLVSPNGKIKVEITIGNRLSLSVFQGDEQILKDCPLSLQLGKEQFGVNPKLSKIYI